MRIYADIAGCPIHVGANAFMMVVAGFISAMFSSLVRPSAKWYTCLSVCLFVCLSVHASIYPVYVLDDEMDLHTVMHAQMHEVP